MGPDDATVDLSRYRLESHLHAALALALQLAHPGPIGAQHWLLAVLQLESTGASTAFERLRQWLKAPVAVQRPDGAEAHLDVAALPVSTALAQSISVARPFFEDSPELWGRDYISIGLLAREPDLDALAKSAGRTLQELRLQWLEFVSQDVSRRPAAAWRAWWIAAGVTLPPAPTDGLSAIDLDLDHLDLTEGVRSILRAARPGESRALSTSSVLVAMAAMGRPQRAPIWIADFLSRFLIGYPALGASLDSGDVEPSDAVQQKVAQSSKLAPQVTQGLAWCLQQARLIAEQTTLAPTIAGRHLLVALTTAPPAPHTLGSLQMLADIGADVALLRQQLYDWMRGFGDDDAAWHAMLTGGGHRPRQRADFSPDVSAGPDLLNIDPEVQALATLIAARDSVPPLSIGLFGDWGSGKTFFMRRLQQAVDGLSRESRAADTMQRDLPFYKRIVQIEFNAWHYVEGNLWASMVEHILSNLRVDDETRPTLTEQLQQHWLEKLGFAEQALKSADSASTAAAQEVAEAELQVRLAQREHDERKAEVASLSAQAVLRDFRLSGALSTVNDALAPMGLGRLGSGAAELQAALGEARSVVQHGHAVLTPLLCAQDRAARWRWLLTALLAPPATALLIGWIVSRLGTDGMAQLSALCTGAATLLTGMAAWLRKQAGWMSDQLRRIESAQKVYDDELRKQLAATEDEKTRRTQELALARQNLAKAEGVAEQARQRERTARADLEAASTSRLLGQFIQDRAASTDYRKHLGVLAVVRDDFQRLSQFIEEENWRLSPDNSGEARFAGALRKVATLDEENADAAVRINRIVLYIDDLDRCPPAKVVDVLQAVHLLLAFPLFVVVVGVDARWIARSLESRYRELLHVNERDRANSIEQAFGSARSEDYLEKIFQIPLWLRAMDRVDAQRMVLGLLRPGAAALPVKRDAPPTVHASAVSGRASAEAADHRSDAGGQPTTGAPVASASTAGASSPLTSAASSVPVVVKLSNAAVAERLSINDDERAIIDRLAPLLGRSPRSLKRFVNVYRLIKAGLTAPELAAFVRPVPQGLAVCSSVLLLLAVDTGLPKLSPALYEVLMRPGDSPADFQQLIESLEATQGGQADWLRLRQWLTEFQPWLDAPAIGRLVTWAPRVSRYSFQPTHLDNGH